MFFFFFSSRRRHTRCSRDWSSDVCSSDLALVGGADVRLHPGEERTLLVLLAQDEVGPVAGGRVRFSFGPGTDSGGTRIDAADVITDEDGIARVRLTAGPRPSSSPLGLIASAPGLSA